MQRAEPFYDAFRFLLSFSASITLSYTMDYLNHGAWDLNISLFKHIFYIFQDISPIFSPATHRHSYLLYFLLLSTTFSRSKFSRFSSVTCFQSI